MRPASEEAARILVLEDDDQLRPTLVSILREEGYIVEEARRGLEAVELLEEEVGGVDLVVSDVVMPEMDGPTMLAQMRQKNPDLKIIFVSGYAEESVRRDIEDDQSVDFLPKPYSLDQINSKVKEVLGKGAQTLQ